uniref:Homeobox domain-containing protein n=1 Tax=Panagrellus redivivus TaxID=6233 RepID=A0A7E4UZH6_PANRE
MTPNYGNASLNTSLNTSSDTSMQSSFYQTPTQMPMQTSPSSFNPYSWMFNNTTVPNASGNQTFNNFQMPQTNQAYGGYGNNAMAQMGYNYAASMQQFWNSNTPQIPPAAYGYPNYPMTPTSFCGFNPDDNISRRKRRVIFTPDQIAAMEAQFKISKYPKSEERDALAKKIKLTSQQVKIWFQNQRFKMNKQNKEDSLDNSTSSSSP